MDRSIVFARLCQCAPPSNRCFLGPTQVHIPDGISISSAAFCTAHGRESLYFIMGRSFCLLKLPLHTEGSGPSSNNGSLAHPSPQPKWYLDWFSISIGSAIYHSSRQSVIGHAPLPGHVLSSKNCLFAWGIWPPFNTWFMIGYVRYSMSNSAHCI